MQNPPFTTDTFKGRSGYLSGIVRGFAPEHLEHYHVMMYQGNTALQYRAQQAIREGGKPIMIIGRNGQAVFAPQSDWPSKVEGAYHIQGNRLYVTFLRFPLGMSTKMQYMAG